MMDSSPQELREMLTSMLQPWHDAVAAPAPAQEQVLKTLLESYAGTRYGKEHGAASVASIADYRRAFPVATYEDYKPLIDRVMAGDNDLLLTEEVIGWAITRGTTKGESKFIPMTPTDLMLRINAGRAMMNFVLSSGRFELFSGVNLNLQLPLGGGHGAGGRKAGGVRLQLWHLHQVRVRADAHKVRAGAGGD
jgi:hypothetical protein